MLSWLGWGGFIEMDGGNIKLTGGKVNAQQPCPICKQAGVDKIDGLAQA